MRRSTPAITTIRTMTATTRGRSTRAWPAEGRRRRRATPIAGRGWGTADDPPPPLAHRELPTRPRRHGSVVRPHRARAARARRGRRRRARLAALSRVAPGDQGGRPADLLPRR